MIEVTGNLWTYPADIRVITTNGFVKQNGEAVMGRGCAREAVQRFPGIARMLGTQLKRHGNLMICLREDLFTFPVKHNWWEEADLKLIEQSAHQLGAYARGCPGKTIVLPRPGCGNGKLRWEQVKPVIAPLLPDNVHVITFPGAK